jgi:N-acetylglucosaminyl-diphospho-decaprenol L-rhamnosyltransferase
MENLQAGMKANRGLVVSIVSHGHGRMVWDLVGQVLIFPEVSKIILTINVPEDVPVFQDERVDVVFNPRPKGFGDNHNAAFRRGDSECFCVLNPDIVFEANPFPALLNVLNDLVVGLVAPLVLSASGRPEDSMRRFITPASMVKRVLGSDSGAYPVQARGADFFPDWVAGMFMLFRSDAYARTGGFDEHYFMYCEDADICTRIWRFGYKVVGCLSASVIHNAQRASHRSWKHLSWHIRSLLRYMFSNAISLPNKDAVIRRG